MPRPDLVLATERLLLRPLALQDAEISSVLISPYVSSRLQSFPYPYSHEHARQRIEAARLAMRDDREAHFAIVRKQDSQLMGWLAFFKMARADTEAYLGLWLGDAYQGQRYGTEAASALVPLSFELLAFDTLLALAQTDNIPSLRLLRGLGMTYAGDRTVHASARGRDETCASFRLDRRAAERPPS